MDLTRNTVLITGGSSGIGLALARRFYHAGNTVIVTGRNAAALVAVRTELPGVRTEQVDMTDRAALVALAGAYPEVNILVNNAAVQVNALLADPGYPLEQIEAELNTNLLGPLLLIKLLLPQLLVKPAAAIVNVTSGLALVPKQSAAVYCATKAGLRSLSKTLRWQLEGTSVRVFELLPPLVDTPMTAGRGRGKITPEALVDELWIHLWRNAYEVRAGKSKWLFRLQRLWPNLAERIMRAS